MGFVKIFASVFILIAIKSTVANLDEEKEAKIDHILSNIFIPLAHVPGVGLGIVKSDGTSNDIFFAKSYGWRDAENFIEADNHTKFLIASITKTFTSTLIVKTLSEKYPELGEAALDIPLKTLLPQSNFTFSDRYRSESMSFRDLMSHRHCLRTDNLGMGSGAFENANEWAYRTRYAKEACDFRNYAAYSNGMYNLLGKLVGELAGSSYEALLEDLLQSLEMTSSTFVKESVDYDLLENMSRGYIRKDGLWEKMNPELYKRITVALSGGGVVSTPTDMAKYMQFHLNYGRVGNQQIVQESAMKWLHTAAVALPLIDAKENDDDIVTGLHALGTGFSLGLYDGWSYSSHSGDWAPFLSSMTLYPGANLGIFTTCNGPGHLPENMDHIYLHEKIFDIILDINRPQGTRTRRVNTNLEGKSAFKLEQLTNKFWGKDIEIPELAGVYGNPVEGEFEIIYNPDDANGPLYLKYGRWATGYLQYVNGTNAFSIDFDTDLRQEFYAAGLVPEGYIDFTDPNVTYFIIGDPLPFVKGASLVTLPEIPWSPDSCGPSNVPDRIEL